MRAALTLFALLASTAAAAQPLEHVHQPALRNFDLIVRDDRGGRATAQWVLRGQTLLRWTRMVTVQRFDGLAQGTSPHAYLVSLRRIMRANCPGARSNSIRDSVLATYPTAAVRLDCPRNPGTNRPETIFVQVMAGFSDLHVVQVSLRRIGQDDEFEFAERHMAGVMLCGMTSREPECLEGSPQ